MLFRSERKPALTRDAEKLSTLLLELDDVGRAKAAATIKAIVLGIKNLGEMPDGVVETLWSMLLTIARKSIMGGDSTALMGEIEAGLDPNVKKLIMDNAK